uniref:TNF receptor-associated factor 6 n=1 Tax=Rhipicephalus zambeziensis TaxID=60191 RepID=A0A224Z3C6_9ACAR
MPDHARQALHQLCDSVSGANWRPTRFEDELTLIRYACCVCHVIPSTTVVLPCSHALCEQCVTGCAAETGGNVCPLDAEPFCEDECQKWTLPAKKKQNMKARCWNEADGCEFVGTVESLLLHYDKECAFHALQCPHCNGRILRTNIAAHYVAGCSLNTSGASGAKAYREGSSSASCEPTATQDQLSALQRQMNEVLAICRTLDSARSQSIDCADSGFESSCISEIKSMEANICSMVTHQLNAGLEELKTVITGSCSDHLLTVQSQVNELVEQFRAHNSQLQEIVPVIRDSGCELREHVNTVEAKLSSTITDTQRSLQRVVDSLQQNDQSSEGEGVRPVATTSKSDRGSWQTEKRFILRRLETFANALLPTLESLRQQINRHGGIPWVSNVAQSTDGICHVMSSDQSVFRIYITLSNAEKIFLLNSNNSPRWNIWAFSDLYIRLGFSTLQYPEPRFCAYVHCIKTSENPLFPFETLRLQAQRSTGLPSELDFELVNKAECRECTKHGISHLCVYFEVAKIVRDFVRDGNLQLRFSLY